MSGACREVVTLQVGHYANHVGTQWWNLQDAGFSLHPGLVPSEINSDVVFREGRTDGGQVTYTPRLIVMDLKGSLRTLRQEGTLYEAGSEASAVTWAGNLETHRESPPTKNSFLQELDQIDVLASAELQNPVTVETVNDHLARIQKQFQLEGSVKVWSDFLRIHLHPKTICMIRDYNHEGDSDRLQTWSQGESGLGAELLDDFEDKLHFFVEECDYLQGFQLLCDVADGFSGVGSKVTELLQDWYGGRGLITWGVAPFGLDSPPPVYQLLNWALGVSNMAAGSSLFVPLTLRGDLGVRPGSPVDFGLLDYDPSLWFHSASVLALAFDSLTASYRLRENGAPMWQLADMLAASGRKVAVGYGALPFPMMHGASLPDALFACGDALPWKPLSACGGVGRCYGNWTTLRGYEDQKLTCTLPPATPPATPLHSLSRPDDVLLQYLQTFYGSGPQVVHMVSSGSSLIPPFPQIFSPALGPRGFLGNPRGSVPVSSVPVLTSLMSGSFVEPWIKRLHSSASSLDLRRVAPGYLATMETLDYGEHLEQLRLLGRCYRDDSDGVLRSSSDDEDDD